MLKWLIPAVVVILQASAADACTSRRHPNDQRIILMDVAGSGDVCRFSDFPAPFNRIWGMRQGPGVSEFRWAYGDKQYGVLQISVDPNGSGSFRFGFHDGKDSGGEWLQEAILRNLNGDEVLRISSQASTASAREVWRTQTVQKPEAFWRSVTHIQILYRVVTGQQTRQVQTVSPPASNYSSVIKYICIWRSKNGTGNDAFQHAEFEGRSSKSCEDAFKNAQQRARNPEYCGTQGTHWTYFRSQKVRTATCS